jgi:TrbM
MNHRATFAIAIATALLATSAAVHAQSTLDPNASSHLLNGYDSSSADARASELQSGASLSDDMQSAINDLTRDQQGQMLSGDEGSACEAILCLSTGGPPSECMPSLRKYFSINLSKPWKTIQARINFLKMCPTSDDTPQMGTLVEAIGHGAGRCDAASLNQNRTWTGIDGEYEISNQMPSYCSAYFDHEYTDVESTQPRYVDKFVERTYQDSEGNTVYEYGGGYWVDGQSTVAKASNDTNGAIPASRDRAAVGF